MKKLLVLPLLGMLATPTMAYDRMLYRDAPVRHVEQYKSVTGSARVKDGDTLEISGVSVRLYGIDAPEKAQVCRHRMHESLCGLQATEVMVTLTSGRQVTCNPVPGQRDRYGRMIGKCSTQEMPDLNETMVRLGQAFAYRKYSMDYVDAEDEARIAKRGVWSGDFVYPWDWRRGVR